MTFDRNEYSSYYLMVNRIHRELMYKKHNFTPGSEIRKVTDQTIKDLEALKALLAQKIDKSNV